MRVVESNEDLDTCLRLRSTEIPKSMVHNGVLLYGFIDVSYTTI